MSAYVVSDNVINELVSYLMQNYATNNPFTKLGYGFNNDEAKRLANDLYDLNVSAVCQRYAEDPNGDQFLPRLDYKFIPDVQLKNATPYAHTLRYQCCEGDCPERPLYQALNEVTELLDNALASQPKPKPRKVERVYSTTETAKEIRKALKENFPGIKFSVRSSKYAGGSSIRVEYTDGPKGSDVDKIVDFFQGADFDGMQDLKTYRRGVEYKGQFVRFGVCYTFVDRNLSKDVKKSFAQAIADLHGIEGELFHETEDQFWVLRIDHDNFGPGSDLSNQVYRESLQWDEKDGPIESYNDLPSYKEMMQHQADFAEWVKANETPEPEPTPEPEKTAVPAKVAAKAKATRQVTQEPVKVASYVNYNDPSYLKATW